MEQAAVSIVALELDFERRREIERLRSLCEPCLNIVALLG